MYCACVNGRSPRQNPMCILISLASNLPCILPSLYKWNPNWRSRLLFWNQSSYTLLFTSSCTWTSHQPPPFCSGWSWSSETLLFTCSCKWTSHQPPPFCSGWSWSSETLLFTCSCKWTSHQRSPLFWDRSSETFVFTWSCSWISQNGCSSFETALLKSQPSLTIYLFVHLHAHELLTDRRPSVQIDLNLLKPYSSNVHANELLTNRHPSVQIDLLKP